MNKINYHSLTIEDCFKNLHSTRQGLDSSEVQKRQNLYGLNKLPESKKKNKVVQFLMQFKDIMIIILLLAAAVSIGTAIFNQDLTEITDGLIILGIVIINAIIGFVQEVKAEHEMSALLKLSEPEVKVVRNNEIIKIKSRALTIGDIVILEAGDLVPADIRIIESTSLKSDESSLTGESVASEKNHNLVYEEKTPLADRKNMLYKGSVITNGRAIGVVCFIGANTELGKIAHIISETKKSDTPLQKNIKTVGKFITIIILVASAVTFILELYARPADGAVEAFLTAVAIAVAAIPESLPMVITIIMSMGVSRLVKRKAIVKRLHAVETLGSTEVICSDKTGTLTQNVMSVMEVYYNEKLASADKCDIKNITFFELLRTMTLCNDAMLSKNKYIGDPTETALLNFAEKYSYKKSKAEQENKRLASLPFDSVRKLMSTVNMVNGNLFSYTKGAPDFVLNKCSYILINGHVRPLTEKDKKNILDANKAMGSKALRVLAGAFCPLNGNVGYIDENLIREENLIFVGLIGMIDPPRKEVKDAVSRCKKAGMLAIMITGDHKNTAFAVAKEIGIAESEAQVITGIELDHLSESDFMQEIKNIRVYARVSPENKVRIVNTFKKLGKIVAMTGDGVNDAPSLKCADIGVGMGITGTDVTKEVADIIITDDNFATIVSSVEEGRRIYSNITKTIQFLLSSNFAEICALFLATIIFPKYTFLLPVQILFVNLITDSLPAIALGLEPPEKNIMNVPPRDSSKNIFADGLASKIIFMGLVQTAIVLSVFIIGLSDSPGSAMTMAFFSLNLVELTFLLSVRTNNNAFKENSFKNKFIWLSIIGSLILLSVLAFTPMHTVLGLVKLSFKQWLSVLGLSLLVLPIGEIFKAISKRLQVRKKTKKNVFLKLQSK